MPGGGGLPDPQASQEYKPPKPQKIKISFAKSPRQNITLYEWALAAILAVGLSYFCTNFALNEVKSSLLNRMEISLLGREISFGETEETLDPIVWEPLYSAPAFKEMAEASQVMPIPGLPVAPTVLLPSSVEGQPSHNNEGALSVGPYRVIGAKSLPLWEPSDFEVDPVYLKSIKVRGHLSGKNGHEIFVKLPGEPVYAYPTY